MFAGDTRPCGDIAWLSAGDDIPGFMGTGRCPPDDGTLVGELLGIGEGESIAAMDASTPFASMTLTEGVR